MFSQPSLEQLVESFCKPLLLYSLAAVNISRSEHSRVESVWNVMMYKIYGLEVCMHSLSVFLFALIC